MMAPTLNGPCTSSSTSATRPSVRRRHSRWSRFMPVPSSCFTAGAPRAGGSRLASRVAPRTSPRASNHRWSESAPRCFCTTSTRAPGGREPAEPGAEQVVQGAPCRCGSAGSTTARRPRGPPGTSSAGHGPHVGEPEPLGVGPAQLERPLVHVDGPHRRGGRARGEGARDRSVAAAEVDQGARRGRRRAVEQEVLRARVDPVGGEDAAVGGEGERQVGEVESDLLRGRPARRARARSSAPTSPSRRARPSPQPTGSLTA